MKVVENLNLSMENGAVSGEKRIDQVRQPGSQLCQPFFVDSEHRSGASVRTHWQYFAFDRML